MDAVSKKLFLVLFSMSAAIGVSWLFTQKLERLRISEEKLHDQMGRTKTKSRRKLREERRRKRRAVRAAESGGGNADQRSGEKRGKSSGGKRAAGEDCSASGGRTAGSSSDHGSPLKPRRGGRSRNVSAPALSVQVREKLKGEKECEINTPSARGKGGAGSRRSLFTYHPSPDKSRRGATRRTSNRTRRDGSPSPDQLRDRPVPALSAEESQAHLGSAVFYNLLQVYQRSGKKNCEESDPIVEDEMVSSAEE